MKFIIIQNIIFIIIIQNVIFIICSFDNIIFLKLEKIRINLLVSIYNKFRYIYYYIKIFYIFLQIEKIHIL